VSMSFSYGQFPVKHPLLTLGGRAERPRPVIEVTIIGPRDSRLVPALLDTGADDTVFPEHMAAKLGIDLTQAPAVAAAGVGMVPVVVRLAEVTLRVADGKERREWKAWVAFAPVPLRQPLLGFAGFLQYLTATFHGDREEVELAVNSLYPGI
jgi:predicted aspartyl protease